MRNMQAFSDVVVLAIKAALAPVEARLAATEQRNQDLQARVDELLGLRDRLTTVETKAGMPPADMSPLLERIAGLELRHSDDLAYAGKMVTALSERIASVEGKPAAIEAVAADVSALRERLSATELRVETKAAETAPALASLSELAKDFGAMRERVAVVEVRAQVPGPAGKDGADGKDGKDGTGWDGLTVEHDGERTFTVKTMHGERVKDAGAFTVPVDIYRGVYVEGKSYERGDGVTWAGSEWHCWEPTTSRPGEGSKAWTLKVKRGRDGKDGKDAETVPVVSIGRAS